MTFKCMQTERGLFPAVYRGAEAGARMCGKTSMHALAGFLRELCAMERLGGRTRIVDTRTLELYDVMSWPHGATEYVQCDFPEVVAHVRSSRASLSGFVVVFTRRQGGHVDLSWYVVLSAVGGMCVYTLCTAPWWGGVYRWIQAI